jgi:hypothetical protein
MKSTSEIDQQIKKKVRQKLETIAKAMVHEITKEIDNADGRYIHWYKGKNYQTKQEEFEYGMLIIFENNLIKSLEKSFLGLEIAKETKSLLEKINLL